ncbi:MAG: FecR family protein [Bacteroidetes bacterium]|nr:FecR family protein [Bacteroidota bacterium]
MNTKQHTEYWSKMTKYYSHELSHEEQLSFEKWADTIDGKKLLINMNEDLEKIDNANFSFEKTTDQAWSELYSKIKNTEQTIPTETRRISPMKLFYRAAAVLLIVFGMSWIFMQLTHKDELKLITKYSQSDITLPDGSIVHLNANSKLIYPKSFENETRNIVLVGEAFFDIVPNPSQPLIISANNAEIKVLGTSFNVIAHEEIDKVEVLVESGIVSLTSRFDIENALLLEEGDYGILNKNELEEVILTDHNYLSWKNKIIDFREENLKDVIDVINHTYGTNILLDSEVIKTLKLTSKYNNIQLDTIIESICVAFNLKKSEINNRIILADK